MDKRREEKKNTTSHTMSNKIETCGAGIIMITLDGVPAE